MPTTPKYKLTYFDIRGRAELIRMMFGAANVKFEDVRVSFEDWPALKPKTPQQVLPILEVDGKIVLSQSHTIARYVASALSLYGKTNLEAAYINQILDTIKDLENGGLLEGRPYFRHDDEKKKTEFKTKFISETAPKYLEYVEKAITTFGNNGFSVARSLSLADIAIYCTFEFWHTTRNYRTTGSVTRMENGDIFLITDPNIN